VKMGLSIRAEDIGPDEISRRLWIRERVADIMITSPATFLESSTYQYSVHPEMHLNEYGSLICM
jgi:hypothetical protein